MRTTLRNASAAVLFAMLAAPACVDIVGADMKYVEREEKRFPTTTKPQVTLSTFDGSIEIRPWDRKEVMVVVEKRAMTKEGVDPIAVHAEQDGDRITVDVTAGPREHRGLDFFGINSRSAKLIVSLPASSDVSAKSHDGSIDVENLTGKMDLRSGDGSIRGRTLTGDVNAHTGDGSIRLENIDGALNVDTGDGSIHVSGKLSAVRARSGDGSMTIRADQGSTAGSDWDITTGDGSVTLEIPGDFNGELDAHTGDGSVHINDVAVTETGGSDDEGRHSRRRSSVRGRLGTGGKSVRIRTGDGSITLRRS